MKVHLYHFAGVKSASHYDKISYVQLRIKLSFFWVRLFHQIVLIVKQAGRLAGWSIMKRNHLKWEPTTFQGAEVAQQAKCMNGHTIKVERRSRFAP